MGIFDADEVITIYSLKETIKDGILVEIFKDRRNELSGGKPIVASANLFENVNRADLENIWNKFVDWDRYVKDTLPEEERMFSTEVNYMKVWVIDDRVAYTLMYPEDY